MEYNFSMVEAIIQSIVKQDTKGKCNQCKIPYQLKYTYNTKSDQIFFIKECPLCRKEDTFSSFGLDIFLGNGAEKFIEFWRKNLSEKKDFCDFQEVLEKKRKRN